MSMRYLVMVLSLIVLANPMTILAETASRGQEQPDIKDLEILKLKLEIEKLKNELNGTRVTENQMEPPSVCPPTMTEQEFIEIHRTYQDKQADSKTGSYEYPRSLKLRYKKLMDDRPAERAYSYLYVRMLPREDAVGITDSIIKKWPDFSYAYRLKSFQLEDQRQPDCAAALAAAEKEMSIDPGSYDKKRISYLKGCVEAAKNASNVKLTFDLDELNRLFPNSVSAQTIDKNVVKVAKRIGYSTNTTTINLKYIGMEQLHERNVKIGPGFNYKFTQKGNYTGMFVLLVPKNGKKIESPERHINATTFKSNNGVGNLYLTVSDVENLKEIRLTSLTPI